MIHDPSAASDLRAATKILVRQSLGLVEPGEGDTSCITNPLVLGFRNIGERVCKYYDEGEKLRFLPLLWRFPPYQRSTYIGCLV